MIQNVTLCLLFCKLNYIQINLPVGRAVTRSSLEREERGVTNSKKKKTKLALGSYRTCAAMDPVLFYSKTKKMRQINNYTTPQHGFKINLKPAS